MVVTRRNGYYILALVTLANLLNYANRNVVLAMYDDLRATFSVSNTQLGLLTSVFMVSHAVVTLPVGWLADRLGRRRVIALGLLLWSCAALASAAATNFGLILASRAIAGAATAACVPVVNALLCDVFTEAKARSVSVFNVGLFVGGAAGFFVGATYGYPVAFIVVGLPGCVLAVLIATMKIPRTSQPAAQSITLARVAADLAAFGSSTAMRWMVAAAALMAFAAGGYSAWFVDFVYESKGLSKQHALLLLGGIACIGGVLGVLSGGVIGDVLHRRTRGGRAYTMGLGFAASVPCALLAIFVDRGAVLYVSLALMMYFMTWYHGPMAAVVDDVVDEQRAAAAQGAFIFAMHLLGTAPAATVVGIVSEGVGLRWALVVPTAAVALAAILSGFAGRRLALDSP